MSLLDDFARPCVLLEKSRVPDGAGGWVTEWTEGAEFLNYQALDTSMEARIAEKQGQACIPRWWTRPCPLSSTITSKTRKPERHTG